MSVLLAPRRGAEWASTDAAREAGITYRQLDYWCRAGVIVPARVTDWHDNPSRADRSNPGTGRSRRFSSRQVAVLRACGRLAKLCAGVEVLAALVAACEHEALPITVAIDVDGRAHVNPDDPASLGACWLIRVESDRRRWPVEPLLDVIAQPSILAAAAAAGITPRSIHRWRVEGGIPDQTADQVATAIGTHPALVWEGWS